MAIAFDSVSQGTNNTNSISISHTCTGSNLIVVAFISATSSGGGGVLNTPTYNGVNMTLAQNGGNLHIGLYYLINPPTGANTFSVSATSGGASTTSAFVVSYSGVHQTGQPDSTNTGGNFSLPTTTTVVANGSWVIAGDIDNVGTTPSSGMQRGTTINGTLAYADSNGPVSPGSQGINFSIGGAGSWYTISISPDFPPTVPGASFLLKMI